MKLIVVFLFVALCAADRLEHIHSPPTGAQYAGGGDGSLGVPRYSASQVASRHHVTNEGQAPIVKLVNEQRPDGSYNFEYETANQIKQQQSGHIENAGTDHEEQVVHGSYSYVGPDGVLYTVNYVADSKGFRAYGAHLPTPPPVPEAIARSLEINAAAAASRSNYNSPSYQNQTPKPFSSQTVAPVTSTTARPFEQSGYYNKPSVSYKYTTVQPYTERTIKITPPTTASPFVSYRSPAFRGSSFGSFKSSYPSYQAPIALTTPTSVIPLSKSIFNQPNLATAFGTQKNYYSSPEKNIPSLSNDLEAPFLRSTAASASVAPPAAAKTFTSYQVPAGSIPVLKSSPFVAPAGSSISFGTGRYSNIPSLQRPVSPTFPAFKTAVAPVASNAGYQANNYGFQRYTTTKPQYSFSGYNQPYKF